MLKDIKLKSDVTELTRSSETLPKVLFVEGYPVDFVVLISDNNRMRVLPYPIPPSTTKQGVFENGVKVVD